MNIKSVVGTLLLAGLATVAQAQAIGVTLISVPGKVMVKGELTINATVTAIDAATRLITLKNAKGQVEQLIAGPEIRNFAQIKVGDAVHGKAVESLTLELLKGGAGKPQRIEGAGEAKAEPGAKPSGAAVKNLTIIADVVAVDRAAGTILVKGVKHSLTMQVRDPEQLKLIEVGDQIKGTYQTSVAVALASAK
jgi:hypothetical protein